uniref:uncharacterized protein LOC114581873 isoform X1 n=2 Tax=Podarcis muralis TaxID=64176 RepID=UPI00109F6C88|nr:uncharacterized protein LOC114581873 isoform X1 [Podarcis muralis]
MGRMSIILSGLIHLFRPLLSSLSGALDCEGLNPWYFLLGLRIMAIFFANGPWDKIKDDTSCSITEGEGDLLRDFCTALCYNQHFPVSIAATWGLVFIALILLVGLLRLTTPKEKKKKKRRREKEDRDKGEGLAIVATASHSGVPDISTIYNVGRRGLPRNYGHDHAHHRHPAHHPYYTHWDDWHGGHAAPMAEGYGPSVSYGPTDTRQTKMAAHQGHMRQTTAASYCGEKEQCHVATKSTSASLSGSPYKGKMPPQSWSGDEHREPLHWRYVDPQESGGLANDGYAMGTPKRYIGQGIRDDGKYSTATKCKSDTEGSMGYVPAHPWVDDKANMAIKRRPAQGCKLHSQRHVTFDTTGRSDGDFGGNVCNQPWMAGDSHCKPVGQAQVMSGPGMVAGPMLCYHGDTACTCTEAEPCHATPPCEAAHHHDRHRESSSRRKKRPRITNICGVPLFDIWVGLILALEISFLCVIFIFQMPRLWGAYWVCTPSTTRCQQQIECTINGRAEKRVALWGLVFTSILFIITCAGYFHLRMCWNESCQRMCGEKEEESHEEVCSEESEEKDDDNRGREVGV